MERKTWRCGGIKGHPTRSTDAISCGVYVIHVKVGSEIETEKTAEILQWNDWFPHTMTSKCEC